VGLGTVARQGPLERGQHRAAVRLIAHVDEVDDDDAAEITQAQLSRNGHGGLQIRAENGLLKISVADERARVDVDGGHRLRLVDDEIPA
jgi:hypothetical protein